MSPRSRRRVVRLAGRPYRRRDRHARTVKAAKKAAEAGMRRVVVRAT